MKIEQDPFHLLRYFKLDDLADALKSPSFDWSKLKSKVKRARKGYVFVEEGAELKSMWLIKRGFATIRKDMGGDEPEILCVIGPGEVYGEFEYFAARVGYLRAKVDAKRNLLPSIAARVKAAVRQDMTLGGQLKAQMENWIMDEQRGAAAWKHHMSKASLIVESDDFEAVELSEEVIQLLTNHQRQPGDSPFRRLKDLQSKPGTQLDEGRLFYDFPEFHGKAKATPDSISIVSAKGL